MIMEKRFWPGTVLALILALIVLPVPVKAEMYIEAYLGGVQGATENQNFTTTTSDTFGFGGLTGVYNHRIPGRLDPAVMGGLKIGTWFVKEGFLGFNYPDWMKYLGFYLDFSYHRLDFQRQTSSTAVTHTFGAFGPSVGTAPNEFFSEGTAATLAFMFAARYGFFPDAEVPFGRLQPYIGVGPAILFSSQQPTLQVGSYITNGGGLTVVVFGQNQFDPGSDSNASICLAAEAGFRWMALKNVSLDVSFKYRFAEPTYSYTFTDPFDNARKSFSLHPTYHLFSGQMGAAYHF